MTNRWWRAYDGAVDDPKLGALTDKQHRAWFNLLCIASANDGTLPPIPAVAFKLRTTPDKAKRLIAELAAIGLFDVTETGARPHNWSGRQYKSDSSTERVKRFRDKKGNVSSTVSETPPETENRIQRTETEKKNTRASALADDWPDDFGDQFWKIYPKRTQKLAAMKKLATLRKSRIVTFADLIAGVQRYALSVLGTDPQYIKNPDAWLNAGRWSDELPTGPPRKRDNPSFGELTRELEEKIFNEPDHKPSFDLGNGPVIDAEPVGGPHDAGVAERRFDG